MEPERKEEAPVLSVETVVSDVDVFGPLMEKPVS
jgi:hypothetical protein